MPPAIRVENLGKSYRVGRASSPRGYRTLRESLVDAAQACFRRRGMAPRDEEFWALKGVDFEVQPGEVVGIIGRNGAGKSTLLKILSRITKPSTGRVELHGRVGSLLEVGTGFHPELTGRENIFLNGAILGMSRHEIASRFDEIVAFADVEPFLEMPVKRYSSGMYVRLAFAVAAHLEPEIFLVDEVLAVGDQAFQKKCIGKMGDVASSGRTVVLVSHNLPMLTRLSTIAVWIDRGRIRGVGEPGIMAAAYSDDATSAMDATSMTLHDHPGRRRGMSPLLKHLSLTDGQGVPTTCVPLGGSMVVEVELLPFDRRSDTTIVLDICDRFGTVLAHVNSQVVSTLDLSQSDSPLVRCVIDDLRLLPGEYVISVGVGNCDDYDDRVDGAAVITVVPSDLYGTGRVPLAKFGMLALSARWESCPCPPCSGIHSGAS